MPAKVARANNAKAGVPDKSAELAAAAETRIISLFKLAAQVRRRKNAGAK